MKKGLLNLFLFILLVLSGLGNQALAYKFVPTELEWRSWSERCQAAYAASNYGQKYGFSQRVPEHIKEKWSATENIGPWHYCGGLMRIRRAELSVDSKERKENFETGISNCDYSYSRIDKSDPWAAEMATTLARGYKGLGDYNAAKKFLDEAISNHPDYIPAYLAYGLLYYDQEDYSKAMEYLQKANQLSEGASGQIIYTLGLIYFRLGNLEMARSHADEAKRLGYPFRGLDKLLSSKKN